MEGDNGSVGDTGAGGAKYNAVVDGTDLSYTAELTHSKKIFSRMLSSSNLLLGATGVTNTIGLGF